MLADSPWQVVCDAAESEFDMAEWVKRDFSKGDIDRAGDVLRRWWVGVPVRMMRDLDPQEQSNIGWAWHIADNWRSSHAMPLLTFRMSLSQRAKRVQKDALIAQRMKR